MFLPVEKPYLGKTKESIHFALLPVKVEEGYVWFEHYKQIKRFSVLPLGEGNDWIVTKKKLGE